MWSRNHFDVNGRYGRRWTRKKLQIIMWTCVSFQFKEKSIILKITFCFKLKWIFKIKLACYYITYKVFSNFTNHYKSKYFEMCFALTFGREYRMNPFDKFTLSVIYIACEIVNYLVYKYEKYYLDKEIYQLSGFMSFVFADGVLLERSRHVHIVKRRSIWKECSRIRILFIMFIFWKLS